MSDVVLKAQHVVRTFTAAGGDVHAVAGIDLTLHAGELLVVRGASGAGKTTLLNLLGGLDRPTSGEITVGTQPLGALGEDALAEVRRDNIGFIFQAFGLVPVLSAAENVELPLRIARVAPAERDARVAHALDLVGLGAHSEQRPGELSGGQQQRVGIARAIVTRPRILIADEPTGQLDSRTAATIMDLLVELAHTQGLAAIVSTHDPLLVQRADRVLEIHDGRLRDVDAAATPSGPPEAVAPTTNPDAAPTRRSLRAAQAAQAAGETGAAAPPPRS